LNIFTYIFVSSCHFGNTELCIYISWQNFHVVIWNWSNTWSIFSRTVFYELPHLSSDGGLTYSFYMGCKGVYFSVNMKIISWKQGAEDNVCTWDVTNEKLWMLFKKGVRKLITSRLVACCYCSEMKEIEACWKCSLDGNSRNVYSIFLRNAAGKGYL
jgi:hypothetical protein